MRLSDLCILSEKRQTCEHPDNNFSYFIVHFETLTSGGPCIVFPQYTVTSLGLNKCCGKWAKFPQIQKKINNFKVNKNELRGRTFNKIIQEWEFDYNIASLFPLIQTSLLRWLSPACRLSFVVLVHNLFFSFTSDGNTWQEQVWQVYDSVAPLQLDRQFNRQEMQYKGVKIILHFPLYYVTSSHNIKTDSSSLFVLG